MPSEYLDGNKHIALKQGSEHDTKHYGWPRPAVLPQDPTGNAENDEHIEIADIGRSLIGTDHDEGEDDRH